MIRYLFRLNQSEALLGSLLICLLCAVLGTWQPVYAQTENAEAVSLQQAELVSFSNEVDRQRYLRMIREYRCPKCQNQNLLDSNSQISIDLRNTVERLIKEGLSDKEIDRYMVDRYGDFVLYKPPIKGSTWLLYYGPLLFLALGIIAYIAVLRLRSKGHKRQAPGVEVVQRRETEAAK